jgi:hypothetical protein
MDLEIRDFSYDPEARKASMQYGPLRITSEYLGRENWNKDKKSKMPDNWNDHDIMVENTEIPNGQGIIHFKFWESISVKVIKTENDLLGALGCLFSDASCASSTFADFCAELGYEEYDEETGSKNKESMRVYKACKESIDKLRKLGIYSKRQQFMDDLSEKGLL